jgi:hypothetical protein
VNGLHLGFSELKVESLVSLLNFAISDQAARLGFTLTNTIFS